MNNHIEFSAVSHTQSDAGVSRATALAALSFDAPLKGVFPLFNNITEFVILPSIFYYIAIIFGGLQSVFLSLFILNNPIYSYFLNIYQSNPNSVPDDTNKKIEDSFAGYLSAIVCFSPMNNFFNSNESFIAFGIHLFIFLLILFLIIYQLLFYKHRRRFIRWTISVTRFFLEIVLYLMIHPSALMLGQTFIQMIRKGSKIWNYFFFVFYLVLFLFYLIVFYFVFNFISNSSYLTVSPFASFNITPFVFLTVFSSVLLLVQNVISIFTFDWSNYIFIALHFVCFVYLFILFLKRPFIHKFSNIFYLGLTLVCLEMNFLRIICFVFNNNNNDSKSELKIGGKLYLILFLVFVVVSTIISTIYNFLSEKKMGKIVDGGVEKVKEYKNDTDRKKTENIKYEILESLNLLSRNLTHQNIFDHSNGILNNNVNVICNYKSLNCNFYNKTLSFFQYVINHQIYHFLDFFTFKYFAEFKQQKSDKNMMILCLKILTYFPSYTSYLNFLYTDLIKFRNLTLFDKFFLYQIQRVKIHRTASTSSLFCSSNLKELVQMRHEVESSLYSFWISQTNSNNYMNYDNVISNENQNDFNNNKKAEDNDNSDQKNNNNSTTATNGNNFRYKNNIVFDDNFYEKDSRYNINNLRSMSIKIEKLNSLYLEALEDFSNSTAHFVDYENFLVDCKSDYQNAIKYQHKRKMIDSGNLFRVDTCFTNFIKNFPNFMRLKILAINGCFINKFDPNKADEFDSNSNSSSTSATSSNYSENDNEYNQNNSNNSSSSDSIDFLDNNEKEAIGRELFPQTKLRLAFQNSINAKKAKGSYIMFQVGILLFLVSLFFVFFIYFYYKTGVNKRGTNMGRINNSINTRFYTFLSSFYLLYDNIVSFKLFNETNKEKMDSILKMDEDHILFDPIYNKENNFSENSYRSNIKSIDYYGLLTQSISDYATSGKTDVTQYAKALFDNNSTKLAICFNSDNANSTINKNLLFGYSSNNLLKTLSYLSYTQTNLINSNNKNSLYSNLFEFLNNPDICVLMNSSSYVHYGFDSITDTINLGSKKSSKKSNDEMKIVSNVIPILFFLFCALSSYISFLIYTQEIKDLVNLILFLPIKVKDDSKKKLFILSTSEDHQNFQIMCNSTCDSSSDIKNSTICSSFFLLQIFSILLFGTISILFYFQLDKIREANDFFNYIHLWSGFSQIRKSYVVESVFWLISSIIFGSLNINESTRVNYIDISSTIELSMQMARNLSEKTYYLMSGNTDNNIPSVISRDDKIDDLLIKRFCEPNSEDLHDLYRCSSSSQVLSLLTASINDEIKKLSNKLATSSTSSIDILITTEFDQLIMHNMEYHLLPLLLNVDSAFLEYYAKRKSEIHNFYDILFVVLLLLIFFNFFIFVLVIYLLDSIYCVLLVFIRKIDPKYILKSQKLSSYLLGETNENNVKAMSMHQRTIYNSNDSIICLDEKGVIEMVNPSVRNIFGYTPDQLLGQSFLSLIPPTSQCQTMISYQLDYMRHIIYLNNNLKEQNKNNELIYNNRIEFLKDNDDVISCNISIMAMKDDLSFGTKNDNALAFVVIIKDDVEEERQIKIIEDKTHFNEKLLCQIIPKEIINKYVNINNNNNIDANNNNSDQNNLDNNNVLYNYNRVLNNKNISFTVPCATICFIDIVKFSEYASNLSPKEVISNLSQIFSMFDSLIDKYCELTKIKLIGDVYMCAGGLFNPTSSSENQIHTEQMLKFALEAFYVIEEVNIQMNSNLSLKIGINTGGPLIAGIIDNKCKTVAYNYGNFQKICNKLNNNNEYCRSSYTNNNEIITGSSDESENENVESSRPVFEIIGDPINVASKLTEKGIPGRVHISQSVYEFVSRFDFAIEPRNEIQLKHNLKTMTYLVAPVRQSTVQFQIDSGRPGNANPNSLEL